MKRIHGFGLLLALSMVSASVASAQPVKSTAAKKVASAAKNVAPSFAYAHGVPAPTEAQLRGIANVTAMMRDRRNVDPGGMKRWEQWEAFSLDQRGIHGPWTPKPGQGY